MRVSRFLQQAQSQPGSLPQFRPIHASTKSPWRNCAQPTSSGSIILLLPGSLSGVRSPNPIVFPNHQLVGVLRFQTKAREIMIPLAGSQDEADLRERVDWPGVQVNAGTWSARYGWGVSWPQKELPASSWRLWDRGWLGDDSKYMLGCQDGRVV